MRYKKLTHELICDPFNPRTLVKAKTKATLGACFHNTAHSIPTEKKKKSNVSSQYKITNYMRKKKRKLPQKESSSIVKRTCHKSTRNNKHYELE